MVYYRKYRPQTISELDSPALRETLKAVLSGKSVPHAFLFTGPKGLGKTSTARIVSKVLNCENPTKDGEPCNKCEQCVSITNGTNIDVLEIDGASNRGIDEIRELRERVKLAPSLAKKKVYIIDEVHMLTTEAFNALLKTIEEPPSHAVFIFCTTEAHKVPATILSRCFHVGFNLATEDELVRSLERIVKGENLEVEKDVLQLIAHLAEGGFRDGTKILEEMVAISSGKPITKAFVEEKNHVAGVENQIDALLVALSERKTKEALELVSHLSEKGIDMKYFITQVLEKLHSLLLQSIGVGNKGEPNVHLTLTDIYQLVELFSQSIQQLKYTVIPTLPLEMAIILWGEAVSAPSNQTSVFAPGEQKEQRIVSSSPTLDSLKKQQQTMKVRSILYPTEKGAADAKKPESTVHAEQSDIASRPTDEKLALLENLLYKVRPINASIAGVLRGSKIKEVTDTQITLEAAYKFHKEKLEEPKTCEIIEKAVREITGKNLKLKTMLREVNK